MASDRKVKLILSIEAKGSGEAVAGVKRLDESVSTLQKELSKISRADQIQKIGAEMGVAAKRTRDFDGAVANLNKKLKELGASKNEIASAASAFETARTGGGSNALARAGSELRALPSTQTGLGFGTDAIGNVLRLSGALTEVAGKSAITTAAISLLTPALGAQAAATVAAAAPIALFVAGAAAIAVALKALTDATSQSVERINTFAESQRTLNDKIASGLTSDEARKELDALNERRKLEADTLKTLQDAYDRSTQQLKQATLGGVSLGNAFDNVSKIVSQDEQALADQIAKSQEVYKSTEGDVNALTAALEDGSLAANDAKVAEEALAKERTKNALESADLAGKELQAQQRALGATAEQNEKRLESIADERAVIEKQIEVLSASGVTSDEVTGKIETLKNQLGLLGKESEYISGTALAVSKARDAEKKAAEDQKKALDEATRAQEQQAKAIQSANTTLRNATQDIGTRLKQTLVDNTTKLNRDLESVAAKYNRDEFNLELKSNRDERNEQEDHLRDIAKLRKDSLKDEQDALRAGDFKAVFEAREKTAEKIKEQQEEFDYERQQRARSLGEARDDLQRASRQQQEDLRTGYTQRNADAYTAQQRDLQQARTSHSRALAVAAEAQKAGLTQIANYWKQFNAIQQNGINQSLQQASGSGMTRTGASMTGANTNPNLMAFQQVIRK